MIKEKLIQKFVKNYEYPEKPEVRANYGNMSSKVGLFCNILLFIAKIVGGILTNSISVVGEAINNLTDMVSSLLLILGFKVASKPADKDHPFGHARSEYLFSMVVAAILIFVGGQLIIESIKKIIWPEEIFFHWITIVILLLSIGIKLWMGAFYKDIGRRIDSELLKATAVDSRSDCIATAAVLMVLFLYKFFGINLDGWMGIITGIIILKAGYDLIRGTIDKILGTPLDKKMEQAICEKIREYEGVHDVHDLIIHDYGPGHCFACIHVELDSRKGFIQSHDIIDEIERDIRETMNIELTIHMDPAFLDDKETIELKGAILKEIQEIDGQWYFNDFRLAISNQQREISFELEIPIEEERSNEKIYQEIKRKLEKSYPEYSLNIIIDRGYRRESFEA